MTDPDDDASLDEREGRLHLSAPASPDILGLVHAMLENLWQTHEVVEGDRMRFEISVIEILGNIVEHAYRADETGRRFEIVLSAEHHELRARLSDNGVPTELDLSGAVMPDELAESGRGLALATAALDDLAYHRREGRNVWDLLLRCGER